MSIRRHNSLLQLEMSSTDYLFNQARTALDVAVITQLQDLKQKGELQSRMANSGSELLQAIYSSKDANAEKLMDDLDKSVDNQLNTYNYYQRNKDLLNVTDIPLKRLTADAEAAKNDKQSAERQYEINQWTSGNRAETLFVYQIIFISILLLAIFTGLWRAGVVSTGFLTFMTFIMLVVIVFTIVRRAQYTTFLRDQRYWNKRNFPKFTASQFPVPDCAALANAAKSVVEIEGLMNAADLASVM